MPNDKKDKSRLSAWAPFILVGALIGGLLLIMQLTKNPDPYVNAEPPQLPAPPLKHLAEDKGIQIGNFASLKYLRERPYSQILINEFEYIMADGEPNWKFEDFTLRPAKDKYDFRNLDQVFEFADEYDFPVRYQHLLWGDNKWLPEWLLNGNYSEAELMEIIEDHIKTVGARYKGKVREYTVVNEAFSRRLGKGGNRDWWGDNLGNKYVDQAFIWAREADPDAILILNDFGNETENDISNLTYEYIEGALERGIPIDAIGMQMHIDGSSAPSKKDVVSNMRRFASLGIKVYVTEFDVNMNSVHDEEDAELEQQARIYADMLGACVEVGPEICPNFGYLGLTDRQTWYKGIGHTNADPLMFTDDYEPKPAFFAIRRVLEE